MFLLGPIGPTELLIIFILVVPYFIPTIIASRRKHPNTSAILALNLLLGWTLIGWIISLVWALTTTAKGQTINISATSPQPPQKPETTPAEFAIGKKFCSKCGEATVPEDELCSNCGAKL